MKTTKSLIAMLLVFSMLLLPACNGSKAPSVTPEPEAEATAEPTAEPDPTEEPEPDPTDVPEEEPEPASEAEPAANGEVKLEGPFLMTTCGQSTGSVMFHMLAKQSGQESTDDHELEAKDLPAEGVKTLVITTGTSGKGMGAAGTDINAEIERCTALAQAAKDAGITVVCAHIEGMSRRTDNADQASIDNILPYADIIVVVEESDSDGLFSNYAAEHDIPIIIVPQALNLVDHFA